MNDAVTNVNIEEQLDAHFLILATQAIMRETDFDALLLKILSSAMERLGAKTGYLLLLNKGELCIHAKGTKKTNVHTEQLNQKASSEDYFCIEVARYVINSKSALILDNASAQGDFTHNETVIHHHLKSILCVPLINQGRCLGVLYLENSLLASVFSAEQASLITLLTAQAAIALDNIQLIEGLKSTQETLRQREQNLSITLNSIGDGVITTDSNGNVERLNPVAEQLTGWSLAKAKGQPLRHIFSIIDASTRKPIPNPVEKVLATGETVYLSNHTTLISQSGREYQIADSAAPIRNGEDDGDILGMVLVFNDVTEAYRLRKQVSDSHQQLQQILADMTSMVATITPNGEMVFVNKKPLALADRTLSQVVGEKLWDSVWFNYDNTVQNTIRNDCQHAAAGHEVLRDVQMQTQTGLLWIEFSIHPIIDNQGKVVLLVSEGRDISSRKVAEQTLLAQQQEQEQVLNTLADAVITIDEHGFIQHANRSTETLFGYSRDEIIGQKVNNLMPEPDASQHDNYLNNYLSGGAPVIIGSGREVLAKRKSGDTFPIHLSLAELPKTADGQRQFVGSGQDLTNRKQLDQIVRRSQKMDALGKLTGGIAHDYNNMLGVILGYCELLETTFDPDSKQTQYLEKIRHAGERGTALTQKLLVYSRQKPTTSEAIDLNGLLLDQQEILEKILTARIQLDVVLSDQSTLIQANRGDLEDVILNLCINAMHAIETNGTLTIKTHPTILDENEARMLQIVPGHYIQLSVADTGIGMTHQTQEKIFDPFFSTKGEHGTGLGLSQAYSFMERCHGQIKVYSELGHGSCFLLYFPIDEIDRAGSENAFISTAAHYFGSEKILIVDDEPDLLDLYQVQLESRGYKVLRANNADSAMAIMDSKSVEMVISDVIMPGTNGYQLADWIQTHYPTIPIQMVSGFNDERNIDIIDPQLQAEQLSKPINSTALLSRMRTLLDSKK